MENVKAITKVVTPPIMPDTIPKLELSKVLPVVFIIVTAWEEILAQSKSNSFK